MSVEKTEQTPATTNDQQEEDNVGNVREPEAVTVANAKSEERQAEIDELNNEGSKYRSYYIVRLGKGFGFLGTQKKTKETFFFHREALSGVKFDELRVGMVMEVDGAVVSGERGPALDGTLAMKGYFFMRDRQRGAQAVIAKKQEEFVRHLYAVRGEFTHAEFKMFLRAPDFATYWADRLQREEAKRPPPREPVVKKKIKNL